MPTIHGRIEDVRSKLTSAYRDIADIAKTVDMLDDTAMSADQRASLLEVLDSLADARRAVVATEEPIDSAIHHARELRRVTEVL